MKFYIVGIIFVLVTVVKAQERPDCAAVQCLAADCHYGKIPVTFHDTCCPICLKIPGVQVKYLGPVSPDCPVLPCPYPNCKANEEALAGPDECCATRCVARPC